MLQHQTLQIPEIPDMLYGNIWMYLILPTPFRRFFMLKTKKVNVLCSTTLNKYLRQDRNLLVCSDKSKKKSICLKKQTDRRNIRNLGNCRTCAFKKKLSLTISSPLFVYHIDTPLPPPTKSVCMLSKHQMRQANWSIAKHRTSSGGGAFQVCSIGKLTSTNSSFLSASFLKKCSKQIVSMVMQVLLSICLFFSEQYISLRCSQQFRGAFQ